MSQIFTVESDTMHVLNEVRKKLERWEDGVNVAYARSCGADNFMPTMLPDIWHESRDWCPYETPVYREAWLHGLFSCALWYLLKHLELMKPDTWKMMQRIVEENPDSGWTIVSPESKEGTEP